MAFKAWVILFLGGVIIAVDSDDRCYDVGPDPITGNYAICLPGLSCVSPPVVGNDLCPSYPAHYVCCQQQNNPGREHRGVWIATVTNIDFPATANNSTEEHQAELKFLLDKIADVGMNAIYFQVRPVGDAFYNSSIEPWSEYLTGRQGLPPSPAWDPLEFAIEYCQQLQIEVHAWINPYRASMRPTTDHLADNHMAKQFPQYAYVHGSSIWMDPGSIEVQNRTYAVAMDLITRYSIAGIHMDDYFYPYPIEGVDFPDNATYEQYIDDGGSMELGDWRRDNVNRLIERIQTGIRRIKPTAQLTISPFGIYRAGHPEGMPSPIVGFDPYTQLYCDAKKWVQEGWVDICQPQQYWRIDPPQQSFPTLLDWWLQTSSSAKSVPIMPGIGLYRIVSQDWPVEEIRNQIDITRLPGNRLRGSWGYLLFSAKYFRDNSHNINHLFKYFINPYPALQPLYPSRGNASAY